MRTGQTSNSKNMRVVKDIPYHSLSSVAWVNKYWVFAVIVSMLIINVFSYKFGLDGFWGILTMIIVLALLLMYPYYHYRKSGGYVKRIPPRFATEKPVFVQLYN